MVSLFLSITNILTITVHTESETGRDSVSDSETAPAAVPHGEWVCQSQPVMTKNKKITSERLCRNKY